MFKVDEPSDQFGRVSMILDTRMKIHQLCATGAAPQDFAIPLAGVIYKEYLPPLTRSHLES